MAYKFIKHLESANYNRKLFYLDRGAVDLPEIENKTDIMPGSEARSLATGEKWVLNTLYKWTYVKDTCDCCGGSTSGNGDGSKDPINPGEEPTINGVTISPQTITVAPGAKIAFTATIDGHENLTRGITWTISGKVSKDTTISKDGVLTIADDEKPKTITVTATSQGDAEKYAKATVIISNDVENPDDPVVTGIVIIPTKAEGILGKKVMFGAVVNGVNLTDSTASFSISGNQSANTFIDEDGVLTIDPAEGARLIIVTATANADTTKTATATMTVTDEQHASNPDNANITGVTVIPATTRVGKGYSTQFAAKVTGTGTPSQEVIWKIEHQTSADTRITSNGALFVGADENASMITVIAIPVYNPDVRGEAEVEIAEATEPGVDKVTVDAVIVNPDMLELAQGDYIVFQAVVIGQNGPTQAVTWSLLGANAPTTYISEQGTLVIGVGETSDTLQVVATSVEDSSKIGIAYVTVGEAGTDVTGTIEDVPTSPLDTQYVRERDENGRAVWTPIKGADGEDVTPDPEITAIKVIPESLTVAPGAIIEFVAKREGSTELSDAVTWTISGAKSADTQIMANGTLVVANDETSNIIRVKATSVVDTSKSGTSTVRVDLNGINTPQVFAINLIPATAEVIRGKKILFQAIVSGANLDTESRKVNFSVSGFLNANTKIDQTGLLTVSDKENSMVLVITAESAFDSAVKAESVVSVVLEESVDDPSLITSMTVLPVLARTAPGKSTQFAVQVVGVNNPSADVVWSIEGNTDAITAITKDGTLFVGANETVGGTIAVYATSVYQPDIKATASAYIVSADTPGIDDVTVDAVIITPPSVEIQKGDKVTFRATVIGNNNPSQEVRWAIDGNQSKNTTITTIGLLTIGADEEAKVIRVICTSVADKTKTATAFVTVAAKEELPETGLPEVPASPLDQEYVRKMSETGKGIWYKAHYADIDDFNKLKNDVGNVQELNTNAKTVVGAINEVDAHADEANRRISAMASADNTVDITHKRNGDVDFSIARIAQTKPDRTELTSILTGFDVDADTLTVTAKLSVYNAVTKQVTEVLKPMKIVSDTMAGQMTAEMYRTIQKALSDLEDLKGLGGDYLGMTFDTKADLDAYGNPPAGAAVNDYVYVLQDETHDNQTAVYRVVRNTQGQLVFAFALVTGSMGKIATTTEPGVVLATEDTANNAGKVFVELDGSMSVIGWDEVATALENLTNFINVTLPQTYAPIDSPAFTGTPTAPTPAADAQGGELITAEWIKDNVKRYTLGDKLDILYVLDLGDHSTYLKHIEVLADFDHTDKRYELYTSPSAWHLVTELHPGFWNEVKKNPDWYKMIVGMSRADGATKSYLTCFTDEKEFVHHLDEVITNPEPYPNILTWTNTVGKGNTFTVSDGTHYRRYLFDPDTMTMSVSYTEDMTAAEPGVSPWATVVGEYTLLANGEIIGPLAGVTDKTGYLWVADHESFMIGSAGDGTQMFCYDIKNGTHFIFDVPAGSKAGYQLATDINERYFMFFITANSAVWGDVQTQTTKIITWRPTGYSGLSEPTALTRPSISVDGLYYLHTSTNPSTPAFTTFDFNTGDIATEGPVRGTSSSAIGMNNNVIFTNTPEGEISIYQSDAQGGLTRVKNETPFACRYVVQSTEAGNQLLLIKVEEGADCPIWFVYDCDQMAVVAQSAILTGYCQQTNPQGKGCIYQVDTTGGARYLLTVSSTVGYVVRYENGNWVEMELPFGGLENTAHQYNQPLTMQDGDILIIQDENGVAHGYDLVHNQEINLDDILKPGGDAHLVQIDSTHMMWCTANGSQLLRVTTDTTEVVVDIPEQQVLVFGFGTSGVRG